MLGWYLHQRFQREFILLVAFWHFPGHNFGEIHKLQGTRTGTKGGYIKLSTWLKHPLLQTDISWLAHTWKLSNRRRLLLQWIISSHGPSPTPTSTIERGKSLQKTINASGFFSRKLRTSCFVINQASALSTTFPSITWHVWEPGQSFLLGSFLILLLLSCLHKEH